MDLIEWQITLNSAVAAPPKSPLGGSFFSNPSLLILPNLFSSDSVRTSQASRMRAAYASQLYNYILRFYLT
jgi:hypothetical protein